MIEFDPDKSSMRVKFWEIWLIFYEIKKRKYGQITKNQIPKLAYTKDLDQRNKNNNLPSSPPAVVNSKGKSFHFCTWKLKLVKRWSEKNN